LNFFALFFNDTEFVFGWWHLIIYATKNSTQKKSPKKIWHRKSSFITVPSYNIQTTINEKGFPAKTLKREMS